MLQPAAESTILSILVRGKSSLGQHLLRSEKSMHIHHFLFFLCTITTLANHCGYRTSLMKPASNSHCTLAFTTSTFFSDILQSFCFLGFTFGLTYSLCSITSRLAPIRSEVDQAKTSLFLSRNCRSYVCSFGLISAPKHMVLSGTLGLIVTLLKSPSASIGFLNSTKVSCLDEGCTGPC
jgi:hypothetical protein